MKTGLGMYKESKRVMVNLKGQKITLLEAVTAANADYWIVYARLRRGWELERALAAPPEKMKPRGKPITPGKAL